MALSKLVIGLVAGIGSVAAIGGITAGIVASRNDTIAEATNETDESNNKETNKENRSSEKNESLMKDQPRSDSTDKSSGETRKDSDAKGMGTSDSVVVKDPKQEGERQGAVVDSSPSQTAPAQSSSDHNASGQGAGDDSRVQPEQAPSTHASSSGGDEQQQQQEEGAESSQSGKPEAASGSGSVTRSAEESKDPSDSRTMLDAQVGSKNSEVDRTVQDDNGLQQP